MDIPEDGVRLPHVKKIDNSNQYQMDKSFLGKKIRPALPIP